MMGRTWDEVEHWMADRFVGMFFFGESNYAMYDLLLLVAMRKFKTFTNHTLETLYAARTECGAAQAKHYQLFNKYYGHITNPQDALSIFNEIEDTLRLDTDICYSRLGMVFRQPD